jgi:hypothetical protein
MGLVAAGEGTMSGDPLANLLQRWRPRVRHEADERQGELFHGAGRALSCGLPVIDLTDEERAAVTAAVRRTLDADRFPHAPRLAPLRSALAKLDPATAPRSAAPARSPLPPSQPASRRQSPTIARRMADKGMTMVALPSLPLEPSAR